MILLSVILIAAAMHVLYQKYFSQNFSGRKYLENLVDLENLNSSTGLKIIIALEDLFKSNNCPRNILKWQKVTDNFSIKICGIEMRSSYITKCWQSYLASGVAPSLKLKKEFMLYKHQAEQDGFKLIPLDEGVIALFDYMLATDQEIKEVETKKQMDSILNALKPFFLFFKNASRKARLLISISILWFCYVIFRTNGDSEFLGLYLEQWSGDYFLFNLFGPITICVFFSFLYKWIKAGK